MIDMETAFARVKAFIAELFSVIDAIAEGCRPLGQELVPRMVGIVCRTAAEMPLETWSVFGFAVDRLLVLVVEIENFFCIKSQMD